MQSSLIYKKSQAYNQKMQVFKSTLVEIGSILKEARERKFLSIKDIRERTCIPAHHILAIESGARDLLPEDLYLIGFIKKFANVVGINDETLCNKYLKENTRLVHYEEDAFDLLFNGRINHKIIPLKMERNHLDKDKSKNSFIKVYHFYFIFGVILFVVFGYLGIQFFTSNKYESGLDNDIQNETFESANAGSVNNKNSDGVTKQHNEKVIQSQVEKKPIKQKIAVVKISKPDIITQKKVITSIQQVMLRPAIEIN